MSCSHMTEHTASAGLITDSDESAYLRGGRYPGSMVSCCQTTTSLSPSTRQRRWLWATGANERGACRHTPMIRPARGIRWASSGLPSKLSLKHPFFSIAFSGFRYSSVFTMLALLGWSNSYLACHYCIHLTLIFVWSFIFFVCFLKSFATFFGEVLQKALLKIVKIVF